MKKPYRLDGRDREPPMVGASESVCVIAGAFFIDNNTSPHFDLLSAGKAEDQWLSVF